MAEHPNAAIARAGMEAFNRGDQEAFAAALSGTEPYGAAIDRGR